MLTVSGDFWARIILRMLHMHIIPIMLLLLKLQIMEQVSFHRVW